MSNAIDDLIAQAESRGNEVAETSEAQLPATRSEPNALARRPSLDNLMNSGMNVDDYIKVSEDGLKVVVENKSTLFESVEVTIDMSEVVSTEAIKFGNPPQYFKTFDGVVCTDGRTKWTDAIEKGAAHNPPSTPYSSADIPFTLDEPIKKGDAIVFDVGTRLGYSLSTTNREAFARFLKDVNNDNLRHSKVRVKLGYEAKSNKDYTWGIVTFTLLGVAED